MQQSIPALATSIHPTFISKMSFVFGKSTPLFRLQTRKEVADRVKFYNVGANQQHAVIVMVVLDDQGSTLDPESRSVVVLFNADKIQKTIDLPDYVGHALELHPVLRRSNADLLVRQARYGCLTGTFIIPPRTTAVFLERR